MAKIREDKNRIPVEVMNYDFDREYPFSYFLQEVGKDVKELEKQGYQYVWLMAELPFYGHPEETIRYRLFGLNPDKATSFKERRKVPHEKLLKKNPGKTGKTGKNNHNGNT